MEENKKYQYWMRCIPGIGNKKLKKIVEYCGSAKEAYGLSERQLRKSRGHFNRKPDKTRASGIFIFFVTLI